MTGRRLTSAVLIAIALSACAGSDANTSTGEPGDAGEETRREIGPRALDIDAAMMLTVDSMDVSGDEIFVRVRVVNGSDEIFNVGVEDALYGPLIEIHDNRGTTYPAFAVEPAGVHPASVAHMRFRVEGPFDADAEEFTVELATNQGRLVTDPIAAPVGDAVRWRIESSPMTFPEPAVSVHGDRTVQVLEVVDRGTHLDVSIRASDTAAAFTVPDDVTATLMLADGTELESLPFDVTASQQSGTFTGVLRFLGTLSAGSQTLSLNVVGIDVEIPLECGDAPCPAASPTSEPRFADPPQLSDLIHFMITTNPLPASTTTSTSGES